MPRLNRRKFLKSSVSFAGAAFAIGGTKSSGNILGANERVRIAIAGLHGRGQAHINELAKREHVEIAYLVDPDSRLFDASVKKVDDLSGRTPQTVADVRRALDDPAVDAVSIATPNHWHSLMTIWACMHEKDVYVEKPCSHNVHEGRIAVEAARKHGRIVQHGTQKRTEGDWANAVAAVRSGLYGKLHVSRAICYKRRDSIGFKPTKRPPDGLDFNLWLGPAPDQPFHENLVHYNWHWFWDTGNGDIGNQGVHQLDVARWGIANATLPSSVMSFGGRFGYTDQGQTANTQVAVFDYGQTLLLMEVRGLESESYRGATIGNVFHCEAGDVIEVRDKKNFFNGGMFFFPKGSDKREPIPDVEHEAGPGRDHFGNFIAAVKSRNVEDLNAPLLDGHYSSALCHLANISYRLGADRPFADAAGRFGRNSEEADAFERMREHLAEGNGLKLEGTPYRLGRRLEFDAASERFANDVEADRLLTRDYRKPFVVPERIT